MDISAMKLISTLEIPEKSDFAGGVKYSSLIDDLPIHFDRVGYYIELASSDYGHQQLWITFNPFSEHLLDHGIPSMRTTKGQVFQQALYNVNIVSNHPDIISGNCLKKCKIEYSPFNYGPLYNASFDAIDHLFVKNGSYGCMQIFNGEDCIFAYNNFNNLSITSDIGIGNNLTGHKDWTFTHNSDIYSIKRIYIYARNTFASLLSTESYFYNLCYSLDIPIFPKKNQIIYNVDRHLFRISNMPFDKIGYMMYLQKENGTYIYVYVTCDAYTSVLGNITIPIKNGIKMKKNLQNIFVESNVLGSGFRKSCVLVSSPHNYLPSPWGFGSQNQLMDEGSYGCFQMYYDKELLFAYNNFNHIPDLGIGDNIFGQRDYTFAQNAHMYNVRKLEIYTRPCMACSKASESMKMRLLYSYDFPESGRGSYNVDNRGSISKSSFNRVGFYIQLDDEWIWISFDAFDTNPDAYMIPTTSKYNVTLNNVICFGSNIDYIENGEIIITPFDYTNNTLLNTGVYGKFEFKNKNETLFSFSGFGLENANDIGFGNNNWTFSRNANNYKLRRMEVFVNNMNFVPDFTILLTGQSNSQGIGGFYDPLIEDDQPHPQIFAWNLEENCWDIADLESNMGTKPLGYQCLAFHFAKWMLKDYPTRRIGIVVSGLGGQSICRWALPEFGFESSSNLWKIDTADLFTDSVESVADSLTMASVNKLDCVLWHQGEADWNESNLYYKQRLQKIIKQYRIEEFGNPNMPFIVGELSKHHSVAHKQNTVLRQLNMDSDKYTRCAFTKNMQHAPGDPIHFGSQGHRDMGKAYYEQYKMITYWEQLANAED